MNLYEASIPQMRKILVNLDKWIETAIDQAKHKPYDPNILFAARLAPDQFAFSRQVQASCDAAKNAAARLTGKEPPKHPDTEQTMDDLRARVRTCIAYLDTFSPADFANAETHQVKLAMFEGKVLLGRDYLTEMAIPNFYFHMTTAYAILRHNGIELGKRHFLGALSLRDR